MIVCREVIAFLDDYVAGDLAPERRDQFDRHLERCDSCVAYLDSYRKTIILARASIEDLPPDLITAILATITRNSPEA